MCQTCLNSADIAVNRTEICASVELAFSLEGKIIKQV